MPGWGMGRGRRMGKRGPWWIEAGFDKPPCLVYQENPEKFKEIIEKMGTLPFGRRMGWKWYWLLKNSEKQ